ncbi:MAG: phosphoglucomutase/phosphomannomutase family protein [Anaerolineales bacterium]|nr:phosphoglucomutase/phosphomannomutase family protein [Anaerolineales bacterium]
MALKPIKFGTDGWRGRIADDYTFSAVRRCTEGFARYLTEVEGTDKPVVVGYDRRFGSESFAATSAEVLAARGFNVLLTDGSTPTPTISYAVVDRGAAGAINITASHNPASDNGFKVRDRNGGALDPERLRQIENEIPATDEDIPHLPLDEGIEKGLIERFDPAPAYIRQIESLVDLEPLREAGLTILVDPMWGSGSGWFTRLLGGGSTRVIEIHHERNPLFPDMIRPEPIPPNVDVGLSATIEHGADILITTDGDADRVGMGDEKGLFVDQLRVYALLTYYMLEVLGERGPIVKTLSTTSMLNKLGEIYDVPVYETGVGFKYVAPKMLEVDALIGGEESGGYAFRGHVPERDGILAGLYLVDMMVRLDRKPSQIINLLFEKIGPHYYKRIDSPLPSDERASIEARVKQAKPEMIANLKVNRINTFDGYKYELEDGSWLLIRFSGTEPIVRVYCETTEPGRVDPILHEGLRIVGIE